jgi:hypothetical protein
VFVCLCVCCEGEGNRKPFHILQEALCGAFTNTDFMTHASLWCSMFFATLQRSVKSFNYIVWCLWPVRHFAVNTYTVCKVCVCVYVFVQTHVHTYTHPYIHTYIHTYINTYMYTYIPRTHKCVIKILGCGTSNKYKNIQIYSVKYYKLFTKTVL